MKKIAVVVGTRPQIIKTAPVIRRLERNRKCKLLIVHTGQHFDFEMSKVFFNEMRLPDPAVNLGVHEDSHAKQTAAMMIGLERALSALKPDIVLVPGDTNSALATALTAIKLKIPCAHLEAGPRQFDRSNPEEANRVVIDHLSTLAFAPCPSSVKNLKREGFGGERVRFTGDTMLDCLWQHESSAMQIDVNSKFRVESGFVFTTIHRQENTEDLSRLRGIIRSLVRFKHANFVFPVHPRTKERLRRHSLWRSLTNARNIRLLSPLDYESNVAAISKASVVLTDSGGLQKEAFWLGVPCVTVFKTTPWPETLQSGANRCVNLETESLSRMILEARSVQFDRTQTYRLFGNGRTSRRVEQILVNS